MSTPIAAVDEKLRSLLPTGGGEVLVQVIPSGVNGGYDIAAIVDGGYSDPELAGEIADFIACEFREAGIRAWHYNYTP